MSEPQAAAIAHAPTRPLDVMPDAFNASRRGITIVSVYPGRLHKQCRHNGTVEYIVEAAPRGEYRGLVVYDTQQWIRFASEQGPRYDQFTPAPIPAHVVADDLISTWARSMLRPIKYNGGGTIGVGVIKGNEPTKQELSVLNTGQVDLFDHFIKEATGLHLAGKGIDITDIHRTAAWFLMDQAAEQLPWIIKQGFAEVKVCIACKNKIHVDALRCQHCGTFLPELYVQWGLIADGDKAVKEFLAKSKPAAAANKPQLPTPKTT